MYAANIANALGLVAALVALLAAAPVALAHGDTHAGASTTAKSAERSRGSSAGAQTPFGRAIGPAEARRTVEVDMSDAMRFTPAEIRVRQGERIRFVVRNSGKLLHEMVLGTRDALEQHAQMMRKFPGMEHDEPYMTHVAPGDAGEIFWRFTRAGEYWFGCLVPGHFEAGMHGKIIVAR